jgi:hypothetical protein
MILLLGLLASMTAISCIEPNGKIESVSIEGMELCVTTVMGGAGSRVDQVYVVSGSWGAQRRRVIREYEKMSERGAVIHFEDVLEPHLRLVYKSEGNPGFSWEVREHFGVPLSALAVGGEDELWVLALVDGVPRDAVRVDTLIRANDLGRHRAEGGENTGR